MPKRPGQPSPDPDIARVAAAIADPARAAIVLALVGGRPLPATELARRANASASSASAHLARLVEAGLLSVEPAGRKRFYALANGDVAYAVEALALVAKPPTIVALTQGLVANRMRLARSCYDHLAGELGVRLTDALVARNALADDEERGFGVTPNGVRYLRQFGIDVDGLRGRKRPLVRRCIDFSEHRPHVAGALGAALLDQLLASGWVARIQGHRALQVTPAGAEGFARHFGIAVTAR